MDFWGFSLLDCGVLCFWVQLVGLFGIWWKGVDLWWGIGFFFFFGGWEGGWVFCRWKLGCFWKGLGAVVGASDGGTFFDWI